MKILIESNAIRPTRAHEEDAGLDLYSREEKMILARSHAVFDTGIHVAVPRGYAGFLKSKSGLNVKHGLTGEGVIDSGYTGSIKVKLYNNSPCDYLVRRGDKISQLVILPILLPELCEVDDISELGETERGENGFGSTGR